MRFLRVIAVFLAAVPGLAQTAEVDAVLDKAGDYVSAYERTFVGVVAEETYRQRVHGGRGRTDARGFPLEVAGQRRDLKSDLLLVRAPAGDRWIEFRDVFEVDGKPVRDRGERNVNLPVLALTVLEPQNRAWFSFKGRTKSAGQFELEYQEERSGTLIRTTGDRAMPSRGRFLIDLASGRVLTSELIVEDRLLRAQIDVVYTLEPVLEMFVPREMNEKYTTDDGSTIEGRATYAKFRRYQVVVGEKVK
jgi:hypothetical protein